MLFNFHLLRALYQIAWYKKAHLSEPALPSPLVFAWRVQDKTLIPIRMSITAKPDIKQPVHCKCKKSKCLKGCSCSKAKVACSIGCLCLGESAKCGRVVNLEDEHYKHDLCLSTLSPLE